MPELNPLKTGDVPYPQYSVTVTQKIKSALAIVKGVIYTKDTTGHLVAVTTTFVKGIYQSKVDVDADAGPDGTNSVQVLAPRSRILVVDSAGGLVEGDDVISTANTDEVVAGAKSSNLHIGKVVEISTKDAQGTKKIVSGAGDLVIVETVGP